MASVLSRGSVSQCTLDEGAVVFSFLDPDVDAGASGSGHGCLVGDRLNDRSDAGCHSRLHLVCRTPVSLRRLDVWATAWPGTPAETGTDGLTAREGRDLPTALALRSHFPTPADLAAATFWELRAARGRTCSVSDAKLQELQRLAAQSIGTKDPARVRSLIVEQKQLIRELTSFFQLHPHVPAPLSLHGSLRDTGLCCDTSTLPV